MAFLESDLVLPSTGQIDGVNQVNGASTGHSIQVLRFMPVGTASTDIYFEGITAPYQGKARWVNIAQSNTPAQAMALILAALL